MKIIEAEARGAISLNGWRWPNFSPAELASRDTGRLEIETGFLDRLQELRSRYKRPMVITSGYRTPEENARKSTTGKTGPHTTGRAVDVKVTNAKDRYDLIALALDCGFTGIGVATSFIHLDDVPKGDPVIPRPAVWVY